MSNLSDSIQIVVSKYDMDKIHHINGQWYNLEDAEKLKMKQIAEKLCSYKNKTISIYGGGEYFEYISGILGNIKEDIICIIDNKITELFKFNVPVLSYADWMSSEKSDVVFITAWEYHEEIYRQLTEDGYSGEIVDIHDYVKEQFPNFQEPFPSSYEHSEKIGSVSYTYINKLELKYRKSDGFKAYCLLKRIIYELFLIKDFLYIEKYIYKMKKFFYEYGEVEKYEAAIEEVKKILRICAERKGEDVLFINIVDGLSNNIVDDMPYLKKIAENNIRISNIITQYPVTSYAFNTIFTGKSPFEIEKTTNIVSWDDSKFLKYVKENGYSINFVSGRPNILEEVKNINENRLMIRENCLLTEVLFRGMELWEKRTRKNIIYLHSCGEIHEPHCRVGGYSGISYLEAISNKDRSTFDRLYKDAIAYVDEELEWYRQFYDMTKMPMIIMGDHGWSTDYLFKVHTKCPNDSSRASTINPAMIITGEELPEKRIYGVISNSKVPDLICEVLAGKYEAIESYSTDAVHLEFIPLYNEKLCRRDISSGMNELYEMFMGICTKQDIYLVSLSGDEYYYRQNEAGDKNLINAPEYKVNIGRYRKYMKQQVFPVDIYEKEKFSAHRKFLRVYDRDCYEKIKKALVSKGGESI